MRERLQSEHGVRTLLERSQSDHRDLCDDITHMRAISHMRACKSMCVALAREYRGVSHVQHRDNVE